MYTIVIERSVFGAIVLRIADIVVEDKVMYKLVYKYWNIRTEALKVQLA